MYNSRRLAPAGGAAARGSDHRPERWACRGHRHAGAAAARIGRDARAVAARAARGDLGRPYALHEPPDWVYLLYYSYVRFSAQSAENRTYKIVKYRAAAGKRGIPVTQLTQAQRQFLRKTAHDLEPIVHIGKNG